MGGWVGEMEQVNTQDRLNKLIAKLVLSLNFAGFVFSNVRRVEDNNLPSIMGVAITEDGQTVLLYNSDLINNTDDKNITDVLIHELAHLLNKHLIRWLKICMYEEKINLLDKQEIYNMAADCAVNVQEKLPKHLIINKKIWDLHFPEFYNLPNNLTTEDMYTRLLEQAKNQNKQNTFKGNIDDHTNWSSSFNITADKSSLVGKAESYLIDIIRESIKNFTKSRGIIPGKYEELISNILTPPKVPYYQIIKRYVKATKLNKQIKAFAKINRKRGYVFKDDGLFDICPFPGRKKDYTFKIAILIDTSGSMSHDDIKEALSGIKSVLEKDKYTQITVLEVDTYVEKEYICKKINNIQFNIKGRGGTTLGPGLFRAKELDMDACLIFTDAMTENITEYNRKNLPKKMIWVIPKDANIDTINGLGPIVRIKE
jgi:predicted metal-dependent peptidase